MTEAPKQRGTTPRVESLTKTASAEPSVPQGATGVPLPAALRSQMETAFGASFGDVRLDVSRAATARGAHAFAQGDRVTVAPKDWQPGSRATSRLIAHELAHIQQQRAGRVAGGPGAVNRDAGLEAEADRAAARVLGGQDAGVAGGTSTVSASSAPVQCDEDERATATRKRATPERGRLADLPAARRRRAMPERGRLADLPAARRRREAGGIGSPSASPPPLGVKALSAGPAPRPVDPRRGMLEAHLLASGRATAGGGASWADAAGPVTAYGQKPVGKSLSIAGGGPNELLRDKKSSDVLHGMERAINQNKVADQLKGKKTDQELHDMFATPAGGAAIHPEDVATAHGVETNFAHFVGRHGAGEAVLDPSQVGASKKAARDAQIGRVVSGIEPDHAGAAAVHAGAPTTHLTAPDGADVTLPNFATAGGDAGVASGGFSSHTA